jgi:hypothetical protein
MVFKQDVRSNGGKTQVRPYEEGVKDFRVGNLGNPYKLGSKQGREWEMGFNKAYFRNLERVKLNEQKQKES